MTFELPYSPEVAHRFDGLYQWLSRRFALQYHDLDLGNRTIAFYQVGDVDAVIHRIASESADPDRDTPYWAELWPASRALALYLLQEVDFDERYCLELGCGLGLAGVAAGLKGARVCFSDRDPEALRMAELNWIVNFHNLPDVLLLDWRDAQPVPEGIEVILAADVAYEPHSFRSFIGLCSRMLAPEGVIYLSEPNRTVADPFFQAFREGGFQLENFTITVANASRPANVSIYRITRSG